MEKADGLAINYFNVQFLLLIKEKLKYESNEYNNKLLRGWTK